MQVEGQVVLQGEAEDDQILDVFSKSHRLRLVNPGSQVTHGRVGHVLLRLLAQKVTPPVIAQHEVRLTHVSQTQRYRNASHLVAVWPFHFDTSISRLRGLSNDVTHTPERQRLDLYIEGGMGRELLRQR